VDPTCLMKMILSLNNLNCNCQGIPCRETRGLLPLFCIHPKRVAVVHDASEREYHTPPEPDKKRKDLVPSCVKQQQMQGFGLDSGPVVAPTTPDTCVIG